jgi:hypothetical protein
MESLGHDYFGESRLQAARSADWLRRCNGALLGVMLVVICSSVLVVIGATIFNIAGVGRRSVGFENTPLIALSIVLVLAVAKICLTSYRRGVDDLAERERWLREMDTLLMVAHIAAESGNRQLLETTLLTTANASAREKFTSPPSPQRQLDSRQKLPETRIGDETVVRIEELALDDAAEGSLRHSLSLWKTRVGRASKSSGLSLTDRRNRKPSNCRSPVD